jgi:hypothetical protein
MHIGNIAYVDNSVIDLLDRQIVDPVEENGTGVKRDVPIKLAHLFIAGR